MLRAAFVALALCVVLGVLAHAHGPLGVDRAAFDVLEPLRGRTGLDVVRVVTDLGSFPVVVLVVALGAFHAARHQGATAALTFVAALVVLLVLVNVTKDLVDRPRPADRFYTPAGQSYPSGHAAYATAWLAAAGLTGRRGLIAAAAAVVVAVSLSRLYLHVHYLTDVVGGLALGTAVFALHRARTSATRLSPT